jgi:hypothetical protein
MGTPTSPPSTSGATRKVLKAIFPALLLGLVGMILFTLVAALFASIYTASGATPSVFADTSFMAIFGFFVGFAGWIGITFEDLV